MKIGIITYDVPHLKTQELITGLKEKGYNDITLIINKFKVYKKPKFQILYPHRPFQIKGPDAIELSKKFDLKIYSISEIMKLKSIDFFLIGGSRLIDHKFIIPNKIINCHSGLIPLIRGLDSLKWTIFKNELLGTTLHFIDDNVDFGSIISHKITPVLKTDDYECLVERHYRYELFFLTNFEYYLNNPNVLDLKCKEPARRMTNQEEEIMKKNFNNYKLMYGN